MVFWEWAFVWVFRFLLWLIYGMAGLAFDLNHFSQEMELWAFSTVNIIGWIASLVVVWRLRIVLEKKFKKESQALRNKEIENLGK